jgi:hypothetical protein
VTEREWLRCTDPTAMLEFLAGKASDRKLRLFAVACCRRLWHLLSDEQSRNAVEVAERFADGRADEAELRSTNLGMKFAPATHNATAFLTSVRRYDRPSILFRYGVLDLTRPDEAARAESICLSRFQFPADAAVAVARRALCNDASTEAAAQAVLLHCIFGNPFRPVAIEAQWRTPTVLDLASAIYTERAFDRMPILSDALLDAGCNDASILSHCRGDGVHVKGCWVVDLLLGKS